MHSVRDDSADRVKEPAPAGGGWRVEMLGGLAVARGSLVLTHFRTRKTAELLAYLAYHRQRAHPRDFLVELLWPECDVDSGRHRLNVALSALRQQLQEEGSPVPVVTDRHSVGLQPGAVSTDVAEFEAAIRAAGASARRVEELSRAVELYRGPLLPGFYEDWILPEQQRLDELFFESLRSLIALLEERGEYGRALQYALRALSVDRLREEAHLEVIRPLQEALDKESRGRRELQSALGVARAERARAGMEAARAGRAAATAAAARKKTESALDLAQVRAAESRRRLIRMQVASGQQMMEGGNLLGALALYTEALHLDQGDRGREAIHRTRIASLLERSPPLARMWFHEGQVNTAAFSPDGRRVLTAGVDGKACLWDLETGAPAVPALRHGDIVQAAAFSPDGRRVVTATGNAVTRRASLTHNAGSPSGGAVRVWDAITGQPLLGPLRHEGAVTLVRFSPDGRWILSAGDEGTVRLWDAASGNPALPPLRHQGQVFSAEFSPDGRRLATSGPRDGTRLWSLDTSRVLSSAPGAALQIAFSPDGQSLLAATTDWYALLWQPDRGSSLRLRHEDWVLRGCFSPDGSRAATACGDGTARVWDAATGQPLTPGLRHGGAVRAVAFSRDGRRLLTGSDDGTARVWDPATGAALSPPLPHLGAITEASFSGDGRWVLTASADGTARVYGVGLADFQTPVIRQPNWVTCVAWSPDGRTAASGGGDRRLRLWDPGSGRTLAECPAHQDELLHVEFSPDGRRVVTAARDGTARIWSAQTARPLTFPLRHAGPVPHAAFSPDGRRLVTASQDGTACLWDARTGKRLTPPLRHRGAVVDARFSPDGRRVLTASYDHTAALWDAATGRRLRSLPHGDIVLGAAFSPDGRRIVTASDDRTARIWDAVTGREAAPPLTHGSGVLFAAFSPDSRQVATASSDGTARVWDAATGRPITPSLRHASVVFFAAFTPDGRGLLTASRDRTARLWDAATGEALTPTFTHTRPLLAAALSPDGRRALTACGGDGAIFRWSIPTTAESVEDLLLQSQLLSGQRVEREGALARIGTDALAGLWRRLGGRYQDAFHAELAASGAPVTRNLLRNGGFEEGAPGAGFRIFSPGDDGPAGWTVARGTVDVVTGTMLRAAHGNCSLDLDGNGPGAVRQTFPTLPGQRYRVRFAFAGNPLGPAQLHRLKISAAGQSAAFEFNSASSSRSDLGWSVRTWEFVARESTTTLERERVGDVRSYDRQRLGGSAVLELELESPSRRSSSSRTMS